MKPKLRTYQGCGLDSPTNDTNIKLTDEQWDASKWGTNWWSSEEYASWDAAYSEPWQNAS